MIYYKYIVKKINEDKVLHCNKGKYGTTINLTEGLSNATYYDSEFEARGALETYVGKTKKATFAMFEIQEIKVEKTPTNTISALPDRVTLYPAAYVTFGTEESYENRPDDWVMEILERKYKVKPLSCTHFAAGSNNYFTPQRVTQVEVQNIVWDI